VSESRLVPPLSLLAQNGKSLNMSYIGLGDGLAPPGLIAQEILLIVYVLLAALFMLIGVTAVSSLDFTSRKRH
jgi:hypothetical protein